MHNSNPTVQYREIIESEREFGTFRPTNTTHRTSQTNWHHKTRMRIVLKVIRPNVVFIAAPSCVLVLKVGATLWFALSLTLSSHIVLNLCQGMKFAPSL